MINEWAVRILLECILVLLNVYRIFEAIAKQFFFENIEIIV